MLEKYRSSLGEVLRRIVGKLLVGVIKEDIVSAAGPLQTCTGLRAGIEAAIHAMRKKYENENTEAILLVDAENAFNNLNREAALLNIKQLCPPFYRYLQNTYQQPAKLIIAGEQKSHEIIYSDEGCTQGDVGSMGLYGLGIKPLVDDLGDTIDVQRCIQSWYADDSSLAGELNEMRKWWNRLCATGPKYGYFPLPNKTVLIVKEEHAAKAQEVFGDSGVKITTRGERHMGAVIGSTEFKLEYVSQKISKWIQDVEALAEIAKDEPQAAYSSYTKAISRRWTYIQRTIPNIANLFKPLENVIREKLIPALVGRHISDMERKIFALPVRMGGLGIENPTLTAGYEFSASTKITDNLTEIIYRQEKDFTNYDKNQVEKIIKASKKDKEKRLKDEYDSIMSSLDANMKRIMELNQEKGAGSWLTVIPMQSLGFAMNKQRFRDAVRVRYDWNIPGTPDYCKCGEENDINHALSCKHGPYVIMRHNKIRDLEAELMREVCHDVRIEPELLPLANDRVVTGNKAKKARLDVAGNGVWGPQERTFLDVRVMHPNAESYKNKDVAQVYEQHEREKKRTYNERIIRIEKGSFTPIVLSTFGGMGVEAERYHKRIAQLIRAKRNEPYASVIGYIRTRIRICLLNSVLTSLRGMRGKSTREKITPISALSFNLIDFE
jgi:hypothetical protein